MSDIESMFSAMGGATSSNSGVFFTEGVYAVELKEVEYRPNGYKGRSCIFRFTVLESNNSAHPVQSTRVWICKLDKSKDENVRTMADIKNLVFALLGTDLKAVGSPEVNPKAHDQATQLFLAAADPTFAAKNNLDPNALIGSSCRLEAMSIKTKPNPRNPQGGDFTRHVWSPSAA